MTGPVVVWLLAAAIVTPPVWLYLGCALVALAGLAVMLVAGRARRRTP